LTCRPRAGPRPPRVQIAHARRGGVAACRSCAVDDAADPGHDSETASDRRGRVKPIDPAAPMLRFQLSDGSVDLMKAFSLGGFEGGGPGRCRLLTRLSTSATVDGEAHPLESAVLASNSPPVHKPAGYFNRMRRGSELGRQVAVDFQSDADFHECRSCPVHSPLPPFHTRQQHKLPQPPTARRLGCGFLAPP
jgi:hypothetical protein